MINEVTRSISTPPLDGMLVHRRVTPSIKFASTILYTWVERGTVRVKCLAQEHNTMSPARAWTWAACSRVECTNHEATAPPTIPLSDYHKFVLVLGHREVCVAQVSYAVRVNSCFCSIFTSDQEYLTPMGMFKIKWCNSSMVCDISVNRAPFRLVNLHCKHHSN